MTVVDLAKLTAVWTNQNVLWVARIIGNEIPGK